MPATTLRRILCLGNIPHKDGITTNGLIEKIKQDLTARDGCSDFCGSVTVRNIQRDINKLQECGYLIVQKRSLGDPGNANSTWVNEGKNGLPGMNKTLAIALKLAAEHLKYLLPSETFDALSPYIKEANEALEDSKCKNAHLWADKVRTLPRGFVQQPATMDEKAVNTIFMATLQGLQFKATYTHINTAPEDSVEKGSFRPLGIINRGQTIYIVAKARLENRPVALALHRFSNVMPHPQRQPKQVEFDIDSFIKEGQMEITDFGSPDPQDFKALITNETANHYRETPLHETQTLRSSNRPGWTEITANCIISRQLAYFLLSYQSEVIVEEPPPLRRGMIEKISAMAGNYGVVL